MRVKVAEETEQSSRRQGAKSLRSKDKVPEAEGQGLFC